MSNLNLKRDSKTITKEELDYKNEPEKVLQNCLTFLKT